MNEEKIILEELRRYSNREVQYDPSRPSSQSTPVASSKGGAKVNREEVIALKQDLNLAARVGKSLLNQLEAAESELESQKKLKDAEVEALREENSRLISENRELMEEHEAMTQALEELDEEVKSLLAKLEQSNARADRLARAAAHARALEDHVHLLEQMHESLQNELITTKARLIEVDVKDRLGESMSHLNSQLDTPVTTKNNRRVRVSQDDHSPSIANAYITPDNSLAGDTSWADDRWTRPPPLTRARSHESVISLVYTPDSPQTPAGLTAIPFGKFESPAVTIPTRALATTIYASPSPAAASRGAVPARDHLLSMRRGQNQTPIKSPKTAMPTPPENNPSRAQWLYVPFRR